MVQEFKDFINKGNMVELAVAFVLDLSHCPRARPRASVA